MASFFPADGVPTTIEYHKVLLDNPDFKAGNVDTGFIPKHQDELVAPNQPATEDPRKNIVRNAAKKAAKKKALANAAG